MWLQSVHRNRALARRWLRLFAESGLPASPAPFPAFASRTALRPADREARQAFVSSANFAPKARCSSLAAPPLMWPQEPTALKVASVSESFPASWLSFASFCSDDFFPSLSEAGCCLTCANSFAHSASLADAGRRRSWGLQRRCRASAERSSILTLPR